MTSARATAPATETLDRFAEVAAELGTDDIASEAGRLRERLREQRFFVACLGQFKRGKSTLLNALVGAEVLPVGVPPVTTALTVLRHGTRPRAEARLADGQTIEIPLAEVGSYVDERRNPENRRGVAAVEIFLPTPLLACGLCLVDTPGLGSVFAANAAVTRAFVPQVDAALIVLGTDPPITGEEADLVTGIVREVGDHVVIVLNKADRAAPRELEEARRFTREVLEDRLEKTIGPILEVSARERLSQAGPTRDWRRLEERLAALAGESRTGILSDAQRRGLRRVGRALLAEIAEREAALRRPLEATEARVGQLRSAVEGMGRSLADLAALLTSTEMELARTFGARREEFERQAQADAAVELDQLIGSWRQSAGASLRHSALEHARAIAERRVRAFLLESEPIAETLYQRATERFVTLANDFLRQLAGDAGGDVLGVEPGFHQRRGFYFTSLMSRTRIGPFDWLSDRAAIAAPRRVSRHARAYLRELVHTNAMRVSHDLRERVLESRRHLEAEVRRCLVEALASAQRALSQARDRRAAGEQAVAAELDSLAGRRRAIEAALMCTPGKESRRDGSARP